MQTTWRSFHGLVLGLALAVPGVWAADNSPDLEVIHRIKQEAFKRSQVMRHLFHMTDVYGPRLSNSPGIDAAAKWVLDTAKEWGLDNAICHPTGP